MSKKIVTIRTEKGRAMQGQRDMRKTNLNMRKELDRARLLLSEVLAGSESVIAEMVSDGDPIDQGAMMMVCKIRDFLGKS